MKKSVFFLTARKISHGKLNLGTDTRRIHDSFDDLVCGLRRTREICGSFGSRKQKSGWIFAVECGVRPQGNWFFEKTQT